MSSPAEFRSNPRHSYANRPSFLSRATESPPPDKIMTGAAPGPSSAMASPEKHLVAEKQQSSVMKQSPDHQFLVDKNASTPWTRYKLFNSPFPRYRHAALALSSDKNVLYIMGGLKEGSVFGDTWKITPHTASDNTITHFTSEMIEVVNNNHPPARVGHSSVLCGNAYIIYGGDTVDTDYNGYPDDNLYMFNINNCKYTVPSHILNKPRGRYGHLIGVVSLSTSSSRLYLFGGQLESEVFSDLYYFELTSFKLPHARWELAEPLNNFKPPPLTNHTMSVYKHKIYIFGGVYNHEKVSNDLWCYDTLLNKWLQVPTTGDVPLPVNEHSAVLVNEYLYVYGGNDFSGTIYDTLHCLDLRTFQWMKLDNRFGVNGPGPRCGHSISYLPNLHKLVIMGGDKNDYISEDSANFETHEEYDGTETGTMIFVMDLYLADHLLRGGVPKKLAASAGGAAAVLSKRPPSPVVSDDAFTRHRKSMSAGIDDFRTPNASLERIPPAVEPPRSVSDSTERNRTVSDFIDVHTKQVSEHKVTPTAGSLGDNFVEVHLPSSAISENDTNTDAEIAVMDTPDDGRSPFAQGKLVSLGQKFPEEIRSDNATPVLSHEFAHLTNDFPDTEEEEEQALRIRNREQEPLAQETAQETDHEDHDEPTIVHVRELSALPEPNLKSPSTIVPNLALSHKGNGFDAVLNSSPRKASSGSTPEVDSKVKQVISELNTEISDLKKYTEAQIHEATDKIHLLEEENKLLKEKLEAALFDKSKVEDLSQELAEKNLIIGELRSSIQPNDLSVEDEAAGVPKKGFTDALKYRLQNLDMANKLVYLQNENTQLKDKFSRFEPFMDNQMTQLSSLQKVIKSQEERIAELTAQVKLELVLHEQIAEWKHKYEDLELQFNTYKSVHADVEFSDDEAENSRDVDPNATEPTLQKKTAGQLSSHLEKLVLLWQSAHAPDTKERGINQENDTVVAELQKQVDDLLRTSQQQQQASASEMSELRNELEAKMAALQALEASYRDAIQSVNNTSKALNVNQDELRNQKVLIEKLARENNELKLFKKASRRVSSLPGESSIKRMQSDSTTSLHEVNDTEDDLQSAHYQMKVKDLEADLYIMKQERDLLIENVNSLKKELYFAKNNA